MAKEIKERKIKGIYKRGAVYWIRYAGIDGKIISESTRKGDRPGTKLQDAVSLLHERKADIGRGKLPEITRIGNHTFNELTAEYLQWSIRQKSHEQKIINCRQLTLYFGNIPLRRFNTMILEQYQTERLMAGNMPATVNRHIALIKHMFTKAVDWLMVEEDILKRVHKVKMLKEDNERLRYLSKEECSRLIQECDRLAKKNAHYRHLKPMVIVALNTGMRRGEIFDLKWDNVDLKNGFILLEKTKNGKRREIPINETLKETLQSLPRRLDGGYVFCDPSTGKKFDSITRSFATARKKAEIEDFRFHDLRHTFASHLAMKGVPLITISKLLGHKSITMTMRYAHLAPSHLGNAVDILDEAINGKTQNEQETGNCTKTIQSGFLRVMP